jgi:TetR/AcrR family transcriptional repressor of nem operon
MSGTRARLADTTIDLVRRQGWAATTVADICSAAGVTKGAFFHHFDSKEAVGVAAAERWGRRTAELFMLAPYQVGHPDPLDWILAYLDFRAQLAQGSLEQITCFAGTTIQETFSTCEPLRAACAETITHHVAFLVPEFEAAIAKYPPREPVSAEDLALFTQTVLQGAFVVAKTKASTEPVQAAVLHLKRYLTQLFAQPTKD